MNAGLGVMNAPFFWMNENMWMVGLYREWDKHALEGQKHYGYAICPILCRKQKSKNKKSLFPQWRQALSAT